MPRGTPRIPGAHRVQMRLARGAAIYWYRYRGGPSLMCFRGETMSEALRAEEEGAPALMAAYAAGFQKVPDEAVTLRDLITKFKAAPDGFKKLAKSTAAHWTRWLDRIAEDFGNLPLRALPAQGMKREFITWRNTLSKTPRSADYAMQVLKRLLSWAKDNDLIEMNPAEGIKGIYSVNRADIVVTDEEFAFILNYASAAAQQAFRLAAATGMRRGDLVDLRWTEVSDSSIERAAAKSTKGRRLSVPLTASARAVIAELKAERTRRDKPSVYVLNSAKGPWSPSGLTSVWVKAVKAAIEAGDLAEGRDLHLHDLRGTAVTGFCQARLTDEEIADIMAWEPSRVRGIRKRYVDRDRIAQGIIARLEKPSQTG